MKLTFSSRSWGEYLSWQDEPRELPRLNGLIQECVRNPFRGTGKPEPLGGNWSGWWFRRVTREHRLVYRVSGKGETQVLEVGQCRYHY